MNRCIVLTVEKTANKPARSMTNNADERNTRTWKFTHRQVWCETSAKLASKLANALLSFAQRRSIRSQKNFASIDDQGPPPSAINMKYLSLIRSIATATTTSTRKSKPLRTDET